MRHLVADLLAAPDPGAPATDLVQVLTDRGTPPTTLADWWSIDAAEIALGESKGRTRTKIETWDALRGLCRR